MPLPMALEPKPLVTLWKSKWGASVARKLENLFLSISLYASEEEAEQGRKSRTRENGGRLTLSDNKCGWLSFLFH
jgi:hypothetical protein